MLADDAGRQSPPLPRSADPSGGAPPRPAPRAGAQTRREILALVAADPGIHKSDLCRTLALSWGSISHHVAVLQRAGDLRVQALGRKSLLFPASVGDDEWTALSALRDDRASAVVELLRARPRLRLAELREVLELDAKKLRRILLRLERAKVVRKLGSARPQFCLDGWTTDRPAQAAPADRAAQAATDRSAA